MGNQLNTSIKRVIVDYNKLNPAILDLLVDRYPYGYDREDIITFKNMAGEWIECVEVRTPDTMYLVKVSKRLAAAMDDHDTDDLDDDFEDDDDQLDEDIADEQEEDDY